MMIQTNPSPSSQPLIEGGFKGISKFLTNVKKVKPE